MYTLVIILLALVVIGTVVSFYREHRRKRHQDDRWLASQPLESIISRRRKAAEKGRALLEGQIDCDNFLEGFGKSEDPEIQKLVKIVTNMSLEDEEFHSGFGKSIKKRISVLIKTTEHQERSNEWLNELLNWGFRNITFPVAIINDSKNSLTIISTLEEYALDPDLHFWPFTSDTTLIDSNGMKYNLRYKEEPGFSYPSEKIAEVDLNMVKQLVTQRVRKKKLIPIIEGSQTIKVLYGKLYDKYHD
jgi:hypothetical protein